MSDHPTSYYEIALTNRQVMTVFVILLLCVVAAFLSGVWFGRQGGPVPFEQLAGAAAELPPVGEEEAEDDGIGELGFFSNGDEPSSGAEAGAEGGEATPRAERPGTGAGGSEASGGRPAERAERAEPTRPAPAASGGLVIQVFSSNDRAQAERVVAQLEQGGFPARLSPVEVDRRTMYRVRVGPYDERAEAERIAGRLRGEFKLDTWITQ